MVKIEIGCGYNKREGFIGLDKAKEVNPDMVCDIEQGLPFEDNSVDYIYSEHALEHITPSKWRFVLGEIQRVAKPGCVLEFKLPYDNSGQRTNADHFRTFSWHSFDQYIDGGGRNYYGSLRLKKLTKDPNKFIKLFYYLFPFLLYEIHFKFEVVK